MRTPLIRAVALAATLLAPLALQTPLAQVPGARVAQPGAPARVIVKLRADSLLLRAQAQSVQAQKSSRTQALGQRIGVDLVAGHFVSERSHVVIAKGMTSAELAAKLAAQPDVEYAVVEGRKRIVAVPNDPFYASRAVGPTSGGPAVGQWYLKPQGPAGTAANTAPAAMNAEQAWDITTGSATIVVADLDTGVRFDHPDLQGGNVIAGYDMVSPDDGATGTDFTSAGDGDGRDPDASDPGDFVTNAEAASGALVGCPVSNSSWHGTQTLGLIGAATNNSVGIAGVARGVKVMPVRVLAKCGGSDGDVIAGMLWAAGIVVPGLPVNPNKARVLNMSLGESGIACNAAFTDAVQQVNAAGAVVVVAAGNDNGVAVGSPANCPGVITVGAIRSDGDKNNFSNLGPEVTISSPGGNCVTTVSGAACVYPIMTTSNSGTTTPVAGPTGGIYTDSFNASIGTSFSTPLVSGTVALMLSVQPSLTPAQVKAKLQSTAKAFPTTGSSVTPNPPVCTAASATQQQYCYCTTAVCGAGMLDAHAAVLAVNGVMAAISLTTTTPTAGQDVALTSSSVTNAGQSIATYLWTLVSAGTTGATITSASNAASVILHPTAAGTFTLQLTTTDNGANVSTATTTVTVAAAAVAPPASTPAATPSSSGGGALAIGWLLLLLSAVLALAATAHRERQRRARVSAAARPSRRR
jgi:serine protease